MKSICIELLMSHSIGLGNNYYRPTVQELLDEYLKVATEHLSVNEISKFKHDIQTVTQLKQQLVDMHTTLEARGNSIESKLKEKDREMQAMKDRYESEIEAVRNETNQKFSQIMAMIQQNPTLAQVKPEALANKNY